MWLKFKDCQNNAVTRNIKVKLTWGCEGIFLLGNYVHLQDTVVLYMHNGLR